MESNNEKNPSKWINYFQVWFKYHTTKYLGLLHPKECTAYLVSILYTVLVFNSMLHNDMTASNERKLLIFITRMCQEMPVNVQGWSKVKEGIYII